MATKITNEQMTNTILKILFGTKSDAKRSYHNLVWCKEHDKDPKSDPRARMRQYLEFELQGRYHHEDDKRYVFTINKDYSTNDYECDNLDAAIDAASNWLYDHYEWYRNMVN